MRYYSIQVLDEGGQQFALYTSYVQGATDPGALQVELDIPVTVMATPLGAASVKIWGVSLQTISQASDFNGKRIRVFGGMQRGLPLANPQQSGLLLDGLIQQGFGNWVGVDQWVQLVAVTSGQDKLGQQLNITLNGQRGQFLGDVIRQTLQAAVPSYSVSVSVNPDLILSQDEKGYYTSLTQFAQHVKDLSASIIGGDYPGVDILIQQQSFRVVDGSTPTAPQQVAFTDLVGQPTWIDPGTVQVTTVMRADLQPTDYVQLPPTQVSINPSNPLVGLRDRSVFQGSFLIKEMRHVGNFRQPDAQAWVTTMNCSPAA